MSNFYNNNNKRKSQYYEEGLSPIRHRNNKNKNQNSNSNNYTSSNSRSPFRLSKQSNKFQNGFFTLNNNNLGQERSPIRQRYMEDSSYNQQYQSCYSNAINNSNNYNTNPNNQNKLRVSKSPLRNRTPIRNNLNTNGNGNSKSPIRSPNNGNLTPNRQKSPIRMKTPTRLGQKEIKIQYSSNNNANGFQKNPQSIKMNHQQAFNNVGNALIKQQSNKKNNGIGSSTKPSGLFEEMVQKCRQKENMHSGYSNHSGSGVSIQSYASYMNQSQINRKNGNGNINLNENTNTNNNNFNTNGKISFTALVNQQQQHQHHHQQHQYQYQNQQPYYEQDIKYIQSVQYNQKNLQFQKGMSVKNTPSSSSKNIPLLLNNNMSPLSALRKNLNSHRQTHNRESQQKSGTKLTRRLSEYPQNMDPFSQQQTLYNKLYSVQPEEIEMADDHSPKKRYDNSQFGSLNQKINLLSPNINNQPQQYQYQQSMQNSLMKKSIKPVSLFNDLIESKKEKQNNGLAFINMKKNKDSSSNQYQKDSNKKTMTYITQNIPSLFTSSKQLIPQKDIPIIHHSSPTQSQNMNDSIALLLYKIKEQPIDSSINHQEHENKNQIYHGNHNNTGNSVRMSNHFNEDSMSMNPCL